MSSGNQQSVAKHLLGSPQDLADENCCCESAEVSPCSPGVVKSAEQVARILLTPKHFDESGSLHEKAIQDALNRGLSVMRLAHSSYERVQFQAGRLIDLDVQRRLEEAREPTELAFAGVATAQVEKVRAILNEAGRRGFCVVDTALENVPEHADIIVTPGANRPARKRLLKQLKDVLQVELV